MAPRSTWAAPARSRTGARVASHAVPGCQSAAAAPPSGPAAPRMSAPRPSAPMPPGVAVVPSAPPAVPRRHRAPRGGAAPAASASPNRASLVPAAGDRAAPRARRAPSASLFEAAGEDSRRQRRLAPPRRGEHEDESHQRQGPCREHPPRRREHPETGQPGSTPEHEGGEANRPRRPSRPASQRGAAAPGARAPARSRLRSSPVAHGVCEQIYAMRSAASCFARRIVMHVGILPAVTEVAPDSHRIRRDGRRGRSRTPARACRHAHESWEAPWGSRTPGDRSDAPAGPSTRDGRGRAAPAPPNRGIHPVVVTCVQEAALPQPFAQNGEVTGRRNERCRDRSCGGRECSRDPRPPA